MKMESKMVVTMLVLLAITIVPSSAQDCWTPIAACLNSAKALNYETSAVLPCCPSLNDAIDNELVCFCLAKSDIISQHSGPTIFNSILFTCDNDLTLDELCPWYVYILKLILRS
ncbi:hypothetical protein RND81_12G191400 [Saponaria officinalis]|uniref:Bifunctional inhibitor/plant lipid transfer protein/seed storage helical domain-containing protein n=1 Tax=Saponaria officinalis TaxID=3572 RepID=A0AAW1HCL1_SAPOF